MLLETITLSEGITSQVDDFVENENFLHIFNELACFKVTDSAHIL